MADKFYAKGPGNNGYIKNLEVLDLQKENIICMVPALAAARMVF